MFGWTEILLVLLVLLLVFGASRLPEIARSLGMSVNEFKRGLDDTDKEELDEEAESSTEDSNPSETGDEDET